MNEVKISGNLVRDPEIRYMTTGTLKCSFSIAHNTGKDDKKKVHYFECVAWKETGEKIGATYAKGNPIEIQGMLTQNTWEKDGQKRSRIEIVVFKVVEKEKPPETAAAPPPEDDIPF